MQSTSKTLVIITGPPGAGKSSTARVLAELIDGEVIDTDQLIEESSGKKISEIFTDDGEPHFRKLEEGAVDRALRHQGTKSIIISLGGGAVLSEVNQQRLRASNGKIFFLDVSIAHAAPRIGFNRDRPLLVDNPRAKWVALMKERQPIYESLAHVVVNTDGKSAREVAREIANAL